MTAEVEQPRQEAGEDSVTYDFGLDFDPQSLGVDIRAGLVDGRHLGTGLAIIYAITRHETIVRREAIRKAIRDENRLGSAESG